MYQEKKSYYRVKCTKCKKLSMYVKSRSQSKQLVLLSEGEKTMAKIDATDYMFADTLKPAEVKKDMEEIITEVKQISTQYGNKWVVMLKSDKQVFINAFSLQNLVKAFGDETDNWKDKNVVITTETSERTQEKKSIVINAKGE